MTHKEPSVGKKYVQYVLSRTFQESVRYAHDIALEPVSRS